MSMSFVVPIILTVAFVHSRIDAGNDYCKPYLAIDVFIGTYSVSYSLEELWLDRDSR